MSNARHGLAKTRLYHVWDSINQRCNNPASSGYAKYGAKGVQLCPEWQDAYQFMGWALLNGYRENLTIERIDVYGHYCPANCTWVPVEDQFVNRRKQANNTSGYVGVSYHKEKQAWVARVTHKGKRKQLGTYPTAEKANQARLDHFKANNMQEHLKAYDLQQQNP